ncbi:MAG: polyprenyl synthetase family protein [Desulfurococcales archaeon]|nr:polyprenyl synthetase family protein [Desulfurococcales archaeon]
MTITILDHREMPRVKEFIQKEWSEAKMLLDEKLEELAVDKHASVIDVAKYICEGGKRFRGFLTLTTAKAIGGNWENAIDAAVAVEIVHAASLAVDDIIDLDRFRRGRVASWIMHGVSKTVLVSLLLISVAQKIVEKYGFKAIMHVIRAWEETTRGEVADAILYKVLRGPDYLEVAKAKTGALFKLSTVLGAIAVEGYDYLETLEEYGYKLGLAYQIADDIVDLVKAEEEKLKWKDLQPGVKLFIRWIANDAKFDPDTVPPYKALVEGAMHNLQDVVDRAVYLPTMLPENEYSQALMYLPYFMVEKMLGEANLSLTSLI